MISASIFRKGVSLVDDAAKNVTATATIEEDGTRTVDFMVASIKNPESVRFPSGFL